MIIKNVTNQCFLKLLYEWNVKLQEKTTKISTEYKVYTKTGGQTQISR